MWSDCSSLVTVLSHSKHWQQTLALPYQYPVINQSNQFGSFGLYQSYKVCICPSKHLGNSWSFYVVAKLFTMQKQQGDIFLFNLRVWGFGIPCLVWPLQTRPRPLAARLTGEADLICGGWVPEGWSLSHSMWWAGCVLLQPAGRPNKAATPL